MRQLVASSVRDGQCVISAVPCKMLKWGNIPQIYFFALNKPKMVNATEGLTQVILPKTFVFCWKRHQISSKLSKEIIGGPVIKWAFLSIRWVITFKIMTHHSSTLSQLITRSSFLLISAKSPNFIVFPKPTCLFHHVLKFLRENSVQKNHKTMMKIWKFEFILEKL